MDFALDVWIQLHRMKLQP